MDREIDSFEASDSVNAFFDETLNTWSKLGNSNYQNDSFVMVYQINPIVFLKLWVNEASLFLVMANQFIEDKIRGNQALDDYYNRLLHDYVKIEKYFKSKVNANKKEFIHNIRNAMAHVNYDAMFDDENKEESSRIIIENDKVRGELPLKYIKEEIIGPYYTIKQLFSEDSTFLTSADILINQVINDEEQLKGAINNLKKGHLPFPLPDMMTAIISGPDCYPESFNVQCLDQREKDIIFYAIMYIGIEKWNKCSQKEKVIALGKMLKYYFPGDIDFQSIAIAKTLQIAHEGYDTSKKNNLSDLLAPLVYGSLIMEYSYFYLNFCNESSKQSTFGEDLYIDNDFSNVSYIRLFEKKRDNDYNNKKNKYQKKLNNINNSINGLIQKANKLIAVNNSNQNQKELEKIRQELKKLKDEKALIAAEKTKTEQEYKAYPYSTLFFSRLRNSITHGYFKIDYLNGLKSQNLSDMIIKFWDKNDKGKVFELEIKAGELIKLFQTLQKKVMQKAPYYNTDRLTIFRIHNLSSKITDKEAINRVITIVKDYVASTNNKSVAIAIETDRKSVV